MVDQTKNVDTSFKIQKLLTVSELAELLQVPKSWVYERTRQGQEAIPHVKLGKYVRFNADEVIEHFRGGKDDIQFNSD